MRRFFITKELIKIDFINRFKCLKIYTFKNLCRLQFKPTQNRKWLLGALLIEKQ